MTINDLAKFWVLVGMVLCLVLITARSQEETTDLAVSQDLRAQMKHLALSDNDAYAEDMRVTVSHVVCKVRGVRDGLREFCLYTTWTTDCRLQGQCLTSSQ